MKSQILVVLFLISIVSCHRKLNAKKEVTETLVSDIVQLSAEQVRIAQIETSNLQAKNIASVLKLNGKIEVPPQNIISVSIPLGGYLQSTELLPGAHISKGEIIAKMQDEKYIQLQEDFLIAKAKLQLAEQEFNRQKELNSAKASSEKVLQKTQAELNMQLISINALSEKLRLININPEKVSPNNITRTVHVVSPIDGYVSKVNVNIGKYVTPADVLFELINPSDIHLNLKVFEKDLADLSIGQKVSVYTNAHPSKRYTCEIILISKDISSEGTADVHCHFETYDKSLFPGMYMNAEVQVAENSILAISETAIVNFESSNFVFVQLKENEFKMTPVVLGLAENNFVAVKNTDELASKPIVVKGAYTLLMKLKNKEE
jgi:cobalt-zinc-cadmium efflux system membrane fusion protein